MQSLKIHPKLLISVLLIRFYQAVYGTVLEYSDSLQQQQLQQQQLNTAKNRNLQNNGSLIPRGSTTALSCDPVLIGNNGTAKWLKNGVQVATVTSSTNAILHNRTYHSEQPLPDVGFLVITNITKEDEGKYWCKRDDNDQEGEVTTIQVAFVDQFPPGTEPIFQPPKPIIGDNAEAICPFVAAVPDPTVVWFLNGRPVDFASDRIVAFNSTLRFRRFLTEDIGQYECLVSNFAGRTSAKVFVEAQLKPVNTVSVKTCRNFASQSAMLWFLVGSLATCCFLLCYMLSALYCLRRGTRNRITLYPAMFLRSYSGLGPGFRKTIVPTPDVYRDRRSS